jgi:signal transduction histidine kinase
MGTERKLSDDKKPSNGSASLPAQDAKKQGPKIQQRELPLRQMRSPQASNSKTIFQLKSELNRLQQRDQEWKTMFSMLGHDLKEPLVTLEGFTKILEEQDADPKDRKRFLKIIREAINSLHLLVGSLQSVSKLYHDPSELEDVSIKEVLNDALVSLSEKISREKATIELNVDDVWARGDRVRLYQIFLNLLANSIKFHKREVAPHIKVSANISGAFCRISITDNGVGMSAEDLKKIFTPFTRLDAGSIEGMGLGLSIVKRIAESFGGRVSVKSSPGVGTTFTVNLPRGKMRNHAHSSRR